MKFSLATTVTGFAGITSDGAANRSASNELEHHFLAGTRKGRTPFC